MFKSARIKLTLWYLAVIMAVSVSFSLLVYRGFTKELGRGFHYHSIEPYPERVIIRGSGYTRILPFLIYPEEVPPEEFRGIVNLAKRRFALQLLIINGGILFLAGTSGYFLAGKTLHPIEVMMDEQKRFVADASHELRTPLTSIKTEVEVALRDKKLSLKEAKELLKSNLLEVDKMKYFSDSLLDLSRYESGAKELKMEVVDLKEVVAQGLDRNSAQIKERKIKVTKNLTDVTVNGNPQSLVELSSILINNAVKYSEKGKNITLSVKKDKKSAILEITDEGIGIGKKDIPHICDRFYRVDTSRSKNKVDGYGLGLSIAKSIVEIHKGEIEVKSKLGTGSKFKVTFPLS